ncbi:DUF1275 family protein [Streptomyces sp. NPDC046759]|uniref:DUF1275 family protein n=1 Tax=Streptomyces sp. NPDC046759 TaxID=3155019 RepID=UPI0033D891A4
MTMAAGAVDAVSFLGLGHAFAALQTGNVLLLAFGVAKGGAPTARPAEALAAVATGIATAHAVIVRLERRGRRRSVRLGSPVPAIIIVLTSVVVTIIVDA